MTFTDSGDIWNWNAPYRPQVVLYLALCGSIPQANFL